MKKMKMLGIVGLVAFALAGCQNSSDRESALEDQVEQLEQQVTSLEQENEELSSTEAKTPSLQKSYSDDDIDTLTNAVDEIVKKTNNSSASSSNNENQKNFFELEDELQNVENRLERYEDKIENDFQQGNLSYENARDAEREIEQLEDKLDTAEDMLENVFGYDD